MDGLQEVRRREPKAQARKRRVRRRPGETKRDYSPTLREWNDGRAVRSSINVAGGEEFTGERVAPRYVR